MRDRADLNKKKKEEEKKLGSVATQMQSNQKKAQVKVEQTKKKTEEIKMRKEDLLDGKSLYNALKSGDVNDSDVNDEGIKRVAMYMEENNLLPNQLSKKRTEEISKERSSFKSQIKPVATTLSQGVANLGLEASKAVPLLGSLKSAVDPKSYIAGAIKGYEPMETFQSKLQAGTDVANKIEDFKFDIQANRQQMRAEQDAKLAEKFGQEDVEKFYNIANQTNREEIKKILATKSKDRTEREKATLKAYQTIEGTEGQRTRAAFAKTALDAATMGTLTSELAPDETSNQRLQQVSAEHPIASFAGSVVGSLTPGAANTALKGAGKFIGTPVRNILAPKIGRAGSYAVGEIMEDVVASPFYSISQGISENRPTETIIKDIPKDFASGVAISAVAGGLAGTLLKRSNLEFADEALRRNKTINNLKKQISNTTDSAKTKSLENKLLKEESGYLDLRDKYNGSQYKNFDYGDKYADPKSLNLQTNITEKYKEHSDISGTLKSMSINENGILDKLKASPEGIQLSQILARPIASTSDIAKQIDDIEAFKSTLSLDLQLFAQKRILELENFRDGYSQSLYNLLKKGTDDETTQKLIMEKALGDFHEVKGIEETAQRITKEMGNIETEMNNMEIFKTKLENGEALSDEETIRAYMVFNKLTALGRTEDAANVAIDVLVPSGTASGRALNSRRYLYNTVSGANGRHMLDNFVKKATQNTGIQNGKEVFDSAKTELDDVAAQKSGVIADEILKDANVPKAIKEKEITLTPEQELHSVATKRIAKSAFEKAKVEFDPTKRENVLVSEFVKLFERKAKEVINTDALEENAKLKKDISSMKNNPLNTLRFAIENQKQFGDIIDSSKNEVADMIENSIKSGKITEENGLAMLDNLDSFLKTSFPQTFDPDMTKQVIANELKLAETSISKMALQSDSRDLNKVMKSLDDKRMQIISNNLIKDETTRKEIDDVFRKIKEALNSDVDAKIKQNKINELSNKLTSTIYKAEKQNKSLARRAISKAEIPMPKILDSDSESMMKISKLLDRKMDELIDNDIAKDMRAKRALEDSQTNKFLSDIKFSLEHKDAMQGMWNQVRKEVDEQLEDMVRNGITKGEGYDEAIRMKKALSKYLGTETDIPYAKLDINRAIDKEIKLQGNKVNDLLVDSIARKDSLDKIKAKVREEFADVPKEDLDAFERLIDIKYKEVMGKEAKRILDNHLKPISKNPLKRKGIQEKLIELYYSGGFSKENEQILKEISNNMKMPYLTSVDYDVIEKLGRNYEEAITPREKEYAMSQFMNYIKSKVPMSKADKLSLYYKTNLLTSVPTLLGSRVLNEFYAGVDLLAHNEAALVDKLYNYATKADRVVLPQYPTKSTRDIVKSKVDLAKENLALGIDPDTAGGRYLTPSVLRSDYDSPLDEGISKVQNWVFDRFKLDDARARAKKTAMLDNEISKLDATNKKNTFGKELDKMIDLETRDVVHQKSKDESKFVEYLTDLRDYLNRIGMDSKGKVGYSKENKFGVGTLISPFIGIAGNIAEKEVARYNSVALLINLSNLFANGSKMSNTQRRAVTKAIGEGAVAAEVELLGYALAKSGVIIPPSGAEDDSKGRKNAMLESAGLNPYSTYINPSAALRGLIGEDTSPQPGDILFNIDRFDILTSRLNTGARIGKKLDEGNGFLESYGKAQFASLMDSMDNTTSQLIRQMDYRGQQIGDDEKERKFLAQALVPIEKSAGGFIPFSSAVSSLSKVIDPTKKQSRKENVLGLNNQLVDDVLGGISASVQNKTPLRSKMVDKEVGGKKAYEYGYGGNLLERIINATSPLGITSIRNDEKTSQFAETLSTLKKVQKSIEEKKKSGEIDKDVSSTSIYPKHTAPSEYTQEEKNRYLKVYYEELMKKYDEKLSERSENKYDEALLKTLENIRTRAAKKAKKSVKKEK